MAHPAASLPRATAQAAEIGAEIDPGRFRQVVEGCRPVVIRALVGGWPVVAAARRSPGSLREYLSGFATAEPVEAFLADPALKGKYYYDAGLQGFNFERRPMPFMAAVDAIAEAVGKLQARSVYLGSVPTASYLPGFAAAHPMPLVPPGTGPRIWLGTPANVSSHYDTLDNLACVIAGRRRFTLYAPELVGRLYPGPIDHTMAGQPVSLAASAPEEARGSYPLFEQIREQALVVELQAGDALYLPKLWWHQVESTAAFNGLVNYWWDAWSSGPDAPYTALLLAMITIAERPPAERAAWQAFFEHYVFRPRGHPLAHLPAAQHGLLGPLKPHNYAKLRARIMHLLRG
ncbi:MAG TPA: cupin-like domain-containing protein [Steroidobacteraceae bacterium]|nr:cupin-like domain-containing protein [Steroidobacteraceae bacterium]